MNGNPRQAKQGEAYIISNGIRIEYLDIKRLVEGKPSLSFNNNLIDFLMQMVYDEAAPATKDLVTVLPSNWYPQFISQGRNEDGHQFIASWTKNVELFNKDFVVLPINNQKHYSLIIVARPKIFTVTKQKRSFIMMQ